MTITRGEVREEVESALRHYATKAELSSMETRLVKWMIGLLLASVALAVSAALFVQRLLG